jgi:hypothetical protein
MLWHFMVYFGENCPPWLLRLRRLRNLQITKYTVYIRVIYDYKWRSFWGSGHHPLNKVTKTLFSRPLRECFSNFFCLPKNLKLLYCISKNCTCFSLFLDETGTCQKLVFISKKFSWLCLTELPCILRHKCIWIGKFVILKVHKRENFLGFDFEICTFS